MYISKKLVKILLDTMNLDISMQCIEMKLYHIRTASSFCGMKTEFWLNLEDAWNTTPFKWLESGHTATFTSWIPGEPSSFGEKCVVSSVNYDGGWNDIGCETLRPVVCERNP